MGRKPSASPFWNDRSNAVVDDASILGVVGIEVVKARLSHLLRFEATNSNLVRRNERSEVDMNEGTSRRRPAHVRQVPAHVNIVG